MASNGWDVVSTEPAPLNPWEAVSYESAEDISQIPQVSPESMVGAVSPEAETPLKVTAKKPGGFQPELVPEQFKTGLAGMQEGFYANAAKNNAALLNVIDKIDRGEKVSPIEDVLGYSEMDAATKKITKDSLKSAFTSGLSKTIAYGKEREGYARNENADKVIDLLNQGEIKQAYNAFSQDPIGVLQQLSVESAPNTLPSLVAGAAGVLMKGGVAGLMTGLASGSFPVEYMASIVDSLRDSGIDVKDPKAVEEKLRDPKFIEEAGKRALTRGTAIAAFDAGSGKILMPFKAGQLGRNVARGIANVGIETGTEMGGEATAQIASGEKLRLGDVIAEGLGAGPQSVVSSTLRTMAESKTPTEEVTEPAAKVEPTLRMAPEEEAIKALAPEAALEKQWNVVEEIPETEVAEALPKVTEPSEPKVTEEIIPEVVAEVVPEIPSETKIPELEQEPPKPSEIVSLEKEADRTAKQIESLDKLTRENSLYEFFTYRPSKKKEGMIPSPVSDNRLDVKEVSDISPDKTFNLIRKKGGASVSDFVKSQQLNDWLPYDLRIYGTESAEELSAKEPAAEEYIKEALRNKNYLPYETKLELDRLGYSLEQIETDLAQELSDEELRKQANALAAEIAAEEGLSTAEAPPEAFPAGRVAERVTEPEQPKGVKFRQVTPPIEARPEFELKSETAEETIARQKQEQSAKETFEKKRIADNEREIFKLEQQAAPEAPPVQSKLFDVNTSTPRPIVYEQEVTPSFTREFDRLSKQLTAGQITPDIFASKVQKARKEAIEARKSKFPAKRVRGADFIRQRLLEAKRRNLLSEEAVDLTEWFILQNPSLVDDLGISIRGSDAGVSGMYLPTQRIARLTANSQKTDTAVHEILHHLERMMPEKVRDAIEKSWLKNFASERQKAIQTKDQSVVDYFNLLDEHHKTGKVEPFEKAVNMIKDGTVPYQLYQYSNPSEFWAVNASRIVQGQFDVRGDRLGALKQWLNKVFQKLKDLFKLKSDAPIIRALESLSKSDGKFVSTEMLAGTGIYPNVRSNLFGGNPVDPTWGRPDDSKMDDVTFILQDKMIDTKKVIQEIEKARGMLQDRWDAYLQEELYHGRTAKKTNNFLENELTPLIKDIQRKNFTIEEVEEYLHNRHAQERNEQNAKLKGGMEDGGSGILTEDAKKYLAELPKDKRDALESIAKKVDAITKGTRQLLVDSGLEEQSTIDSWEKAYKNYVPLNREEFDYELSNIGKGVGKGFNVRGAFSKRAAGSAREVVDILANVALQRERAIVRAEKDRVSQAVYGLAIQHPNPDFWLAVDPQAIKDPDQTIKDLEDIGIDGEAALNIMKEPTHTYVDPTTGTVSQRINPSLRGAENVLAVRVNGKDKYVFFNTKDPRAVRMVAALKNLDADQLSRLESIVGRITRYFSSVNTQYNPIFGVINFIRDYEGAALNLTNTPISDKTTQVLKDTWPALYGIYGDIRSRRKGEGPKVNEWSRLWNEYQEEGGQTGFRDQFSRSQERADALQKLLDPSSWAESDLGKFFTANGTLKVPFETVRKGAAPLFNWLSDYNQTMENAVRLSAYKAALDKGLSKQRSASVAKNLTVNFNRKGQIARQMGAWYAFYNASVQGVARIYQTLRGPAGKKIFWGGLLVGSVQAMALAFAGFDEDEPPDFIKERNLIIPLPDKKYLSVPMPLGFNVIPNTGRVLTEWAMSGAKDTSKRVAQLFGSYLDAFNPIGNAGWSFQTFAPTIADPAVALFENKDWTGKPIAKKDISSLDPTPGYTRAKESASWFSKNLAEFINYVTGGTKYRPGEVSPTPDQIDYLIGQVTGGVGREALKVEQTITSAITGEELPPYKIPLVGRFYGEAQSQAAQSQKFYDNIRLLNEHENEIKGRLKNRESIQDYIDENPEYRLFKSAEKVEKSIQKLRNRRAELIKEDAPKDQVQQIEGRITDIMTLFNERVKQAKESK